MVGIYFVNPNYKLFMTIVDGDGNEGFSQYSSLTENYVFNDIDTVESNGEVWH